MPKYLVFIAVLVYNLSFAQSLIDDLPAKPEESELKTTAAFKANRIALGHSVKTVGKGELNFAAMHNFGALNSGFYEFFGLDGANTALNFD